MEHYWKGWTGHYNKQFYIVKDMKTGVIHECWPNAGMMHSVTDNSVFNVGDDIAIWVAEDHK